CRRLNRLTLFLLYTAKQPLPDAHCHKNVVDNRKIINNPSNILLKHDMYFPEDSVDVELICPFLRILN
ncbi:TPA: hypothetical protein ACNROV_001022, partial [Citrobacter freundii]